MYLFGGKFCMLADGSRECDCDEIVNKDPKCVCDRKHFNNVLWATVTVFQTSGEGSQCPPTAPVSRGSTRQLKKLPHLTGRSLSLLQRYSSIIPFILTQEDWNVVLFNGMEKTSHWAALYFVALMTFGNYVLFNLLVAILVEGFSSERNERREREQRELAKAQAAATRKYSECYSDDVYSSCSASESDSFPPELKNEWEQEQTRKAKDNGHREKENCWKMRQKQINNGQCEAKCNIQKESQMLSGAAMPIITHTAATPQDSPNTTLDPTSREFNNRLHSAMALYSSTLSIDSIDCSMSSQGSGLLKPPNLTVNNLNPQMSRRVSLVTSPNTSLPKKEPPSMAPRFQRGYSWKLSRPSLKRKSKSPSDPEEEQDIVLNNNNHLLTSPLHLSDHSHCNGGLLGNTIRNNTQCRRPSCAATSNNLLSPQGSLRNRANSGCCHVPQVAWVGGSTLARQNSLSGGSSCSNQNSQLMPPSLPAVQITKVGSPHNSHMSVNSGRDLSAHNLSEGYSKTLNKLAECPPSPAPLPKVNKVREPLVEKPPAPLPEEATQTDEDLPPAIKKVFFFFEQKGCLKERVDFSLYIFHPDHPFRLSCARFVGRKWFDNAVLLFIALNCITLAMERPNIPPDSPERLFLSSANYVFTVVFAIEMFVKVVATGMFYGEDAYFMSGWNVMDGLLVIISIIDLLLSLLTASSPRIFGILRVFRLLRSLRPLRVINRAPGLKLVVQTLLSSLRPIGNIVLICCTFFIIFGILGVQLFKGMFYYCVGPDIKNVKNKTDCLADSRNMWVNRKYNFDDLGKALMSLFVLSSRDGWVNIMYTGLDAVGVDQQPIENYSEWRLLYFISFILLVGFFVLNMFVGVVVENFHRCREEQEKEERVRRMAKRAKQMEKKRRKIYSLCLYCDPGLYLTDIVFLEMHEPPYYTTYSRSRLFVHNVVTSKYFDLAIAAVIGLNVITMAMEFYMMPKALSYALKIFNYFFTAVFILESIMKLVALGLRLYLKDKWNQLDIGIVILSIVGIALEEVESKIIPINPTIIRVMRVLRIARVLKLLKMAKGIRALLDTVMQALPQVGNLGLLFFLLFFIFAALGVELFGRLECSEEHQCQGLGEHAHFSNFGMAFLTLFRVATGDNWNGIMKDTLRDECDDQADCVRNCCVHAGIAPIFFVIFVLMAQFVLVNVVVAVLMKHLEESHKQMEDELDMEVELERELAQEQLEEEEEELCMQLALEQDAIHRPLAKVLSLPANFTFSSSYCESESPSRGSRRRSSINSWGKNKEENLLKNNRRRQTLQGPALLIPPAYPAMGYTTVYTTAQDKDNIETGKRLFAEGMRKPTVRRVSSDSSTRRRSVVDELPSPSPSLLSVPKLGSSLLSAPGGSCRRLMSLTELEVTTPHDPPSEDISPECVSPAVLLVPPPYPHPLHPEASSPSPSPDSSEPPETKDHASDEVSYNSKSEMDIQILVVEDNVTVLPTDTQELTACERGKPSEVRPVTPGQRVRIRLCDTRLDSGIGDDKHSQESQPSSSGPYDPVADPGLDRVTSELS
ncbi:low voltage-gated calcium channel activity protein [Homalodisca vitripennis]|nr:low voltage-gated calcium channel activity protein [Homalodisca vitripennis]